MTDDLDFDFEFDRGKSASGTRDREGADGDGTRDSANDRNGPAERGNGRADRANGRTAKDSNGRAKASDGRAKTSKRRTKTRDGRTKPGNGRARPGNGRPGARDGRPPLRPVDEEAPPPRELSPRQPSPRDASLREPSAPAGDDWLDLGGEELGADDLGTIAAPDDGPAGPPTPREGRELARGARLRATGRGEDGDFEDLLAHQPQKSEVAKRGSAIVYGLRGLLDDGKHRLRDGAAALRGGAGALRGGRERISALRERVPASIPRPGSAEGAPPPPRLPKRLGSGRPRKPEPGRIKKLRLAVIAIGVAALAMVSMVFGMMMAVAGDLPQLENEAQYKAAKNSEVFDAEGRKVGTLLSNSQRRLIESEDISPYVKQAVVAIEDERFYEHRGVDFQGIARAVVADVMPGGSTQGASTITQQFVKNALDAQGSRTYFQKLREAAYAYHLERQWDKDKILTQYLNTIYFGEGAYGIESAARTYFGYNHPECLAEGADSCASEMLPHESALLAGIISSPSAASPRGNPEGALARRNLVLQKMVQQGALTQEEYDTAAAEALPAPSDIEKPPEDSLSPYFTSWLRQQLVDRYGAGRAFSGGLDVHTTIDLDMQGAAEQIAYDTLSGIEPTASVVVLDNETGAVKAMVGGNDFQEEPFNIATNGQRQPGSAFKPFVLAAYLKAGGSPYDTYTSGEKEWIVPNSAGKERFPVENYEDNYLGSATVESATKYSDNSVFTEMGLGPPPGGKGGVLGGIRKGPRQIARLAEAMGIRTGVDRIPAITLGAPSIGFTPLEMTYAFNAIAAGGRRVGSNLDSCAGNKSLEELCPTGITKIVGPDGGTQEKFEAKSQQVLPEGVADTTKSLLHGPVSSGGTGSDAQTPGDEWGKTGTTENHGDAWFCGGTDHLTACVWVGHAQNNTPMETEFAGEPVAGGTFPAQIWGSIMTSLEQIYDDRVAEREADEEDDDEDSEESTDEDSSSSGGSSSGYTPPAGGGGSGGGSGGGGGSGQSAPAPAPSGGGGATGTGGTGL